MGGISGHESWILVYRHHVRKRRLVLGTYPVMSLADTRVAAKVATGKRGFQSESTPKLPPGIKPGIVRSHYTASGFLMLRPDYAKGVK